MPIKKVVFDMDDILWDFNGRVCSRIGLNQNHIVTFKVSENPILTDSEKERLKNAYADESMFDNITWDPAIGRIKNLVQKGADVSVNSNCGSPGVVVKKRPQLLEATGLPDEKIMLNLITVDNHHAKDIGEDVDVFVDDNPYNVLASFAKVNLMINRPWNMSKDVRQMLSKKNVVFFNCLDDVITYIEDNVLAA